MPELIGDPCQPSDLIIPAIDGAHTTVGQEGYIFLSGSKLWFYTGSAMELITSA